MRLNPTSTLEPSWSSSSTDANFILREIDEYVADAREDSDSIYHLIEGDDDEEVVADSEAVGPSVHADSYT